MIVEVVGGAATAPEVRVSGVDDLRQLHVAVGALTPEEVDEALRSAALGRLSDDDTAVLDVAALRQAFPSLASGIAPFDGLRRSPGRTRQGPAKVTSPAAKCR